MFAAFNHNGLLTFNQKTKKWVIGANLDEYIGYHFGPYAYIHLNGEHPFDEAVEHNVHAMQIWADKKKERELIKQVGEEIIEGFKTKVELVVAKGPTFTVNDNGEDIPFRDREPDFTPGNATIFIVVTGDFLEIGEAGTGIHRE